MRDFLRSFFAAVLAIVVVVGGAAGILTLKMSGKVDIEKGSYLVVDIYGPMPVYAAPAGVLSALTGGDAETLHRVLENLAKARVDERIDGVILKMSSANGMGWAAMQEIRAGIKELQAAGKSVYGFSDSMDSKTYYLASACDSLFAPPSAYISFTGFATVSTHFRQTLTKLGVEPDLHAIKDYKTAAEVVTRDEMSESAREMSAWLLQEGKEMYSDALLADRGLSPERVEALMALAELSAAEAQQHGLIDRVLYFDELEQLLTDDPEESPSYVTQSRYAEEDPASLGMKGDDIIAVIHVHGLLGGRQSRVDPLLGAMIGHETVTAQLRRAREDDEIKAIVLRVDSRGGDSLTSDLIGHEVGQTARDKPVIVSMVNMATSGGYMISYRANKIVADPFSITGSIGSITGKFDLSGLYGKLGITHDSVTSGPMALFSSDTRSYTEDERARFEARHWNDFNRWLADVAAYRGLSLEEAESLAHGRVWTGRQAVANGLADEIGGLDRAIEVAKDLAGIDPEDKVTLMHLPEPQELLELLISGGAENEVAVGQALTAELRRNIAQTHQLVTHGSWMMAPSFDVR